MAAMKMKNGRKTGLIGPGEVALILRISRNSVLNWAKNGKIPAIIIEKTYRFDLEVLVKELKLPPSVLN